MGPLKCLFVYAFALVKIMFIKVVSHKEKEGREKEKNESDIE